MPGGVARRAARARHERVAGRELSNSASGRGPIAAAGRRGAPARFESAGQPRGVGATHSARSARRRAVPGAARRGQLRVLGRARLRAARREVAKAVRARKARVVLVAPNIEPIAAQGGLDDQLDDILRTAEGNGTPVVFCGSRKKLGQARAPPRPPHPMRDRDEQASEARCAAERRRARRRAGRGGRVRVVLCQLRRPGAAAGQTNAARSEPALPEVLATRPPPTCVPDALNP